MTTHAVVLGGGVAGLLSAAVLAEAFSGVTIIERDRLSDSAVGRRGVPQGPHLHSVLSRGWQTIDSLVPGLLADLTAAGAIVLDDARLGARMHIQTGPYTFNRTDPTADPAALAAYLATRPLVEFLLRQRVAALDNVTIRDGHDISDLVASQHRITGAVVHDRAAGSAETLTADLVVDATGRAARTPLQLQKHGFAQPPSESFTVHGVYYSQQVTIPDHDTFAERLVLVLPEGGTSRGGLVAGEHGVWTLTVATRADDTRPAPESFDDMLVLAEEFLPPHMLAALRHAHPLTGVAVYRYPGGTWHRYDRQADLPDGLLVVGDALCCLNPINGQGITMAALHADALRTHLRSADVVDPQRFYRELATVIAPVWAANQPVGQSDSRTFRQRLQRRALGWSRRKILEAADDIVVAERLSRVMNMIDPPQRLLEPALLARVAAHHGRRALKRNLREPVLRWMFPAAAIVSARMSRCRATTGRVRNGAH